MTTAPVRVLMVCLGNICRSPLAEGILKAQAAARGARLAVDSAGISNYHEGEPPHHGSIDIARERGVSIDDQRSRPVRPADFHDFDWLLAMDTSNKNALLHMAPPGFDRSRVKLLLDFAEFGPRDVPDPYYTGGFGEVFDLIAAGCAGFLDHLGVAPVGSGS